jgi:DNA topoisomerase-1
MAKNLVIVESPAKAKTIEGFLGKDFTVKSSFGHVMDLSKKNLGVDIENGFTPNYEISADKKKVVSELKKLAKAAETIWLASDEDREGEAISWHLSNALNLEESKTKRIVFHEITKSAIQNAIKNPRSIDKNLVDAQQARRVLDRLVGFELSPLLWKKVKPALSAGRVQSVAVRLIVEREEEVKNFKSESNFRITAKFEIVNGKSTLSAEIPSRFKTKEDALEFIEKCKSANFYIKDVEKKPAKKSPAAPFTTSTLQQEASRKLGYSVANTMRVAQQLYESGKITYMRTDSVNLSNLAISMAKEEITSLYGADYVKTRKYKTKAKGAQEAHEAIRPTYLNNKNIDGDASQKKLYELIWKRTIASQMSDAALEKTNITIDISTAEKNFVARGEVVKFEGFLKVYLESTDDENGTNGEISGVLPPVKIGDSLARSEIRGEEKFTQHPPRYTEASLVRKMEELGIGRPSTYAPTISTIQKREYVVKEDRDGVNRKYNCIVLKGDEISDDQKTEKTGFEKSKLFPTDIGTLVNKFLIQYFDNILDYNFTASVEKDFDAIADGKKVWNDMISNFYGPFHNQIEDTLEKSKKFSGEKLLGVDPVSGRNIFVKIGRYGAIAQMGETDSEEKPKFAGLKKGQSIETLTLEEALELFKFPRQIGSYEEDPITVAIGRFGPYVMHNKKFYSIGKEEDPADITPERAIEIIEEKRKKEIENTIRLFDENPDVKVLKGRFGPYISISKKNFKIPKDMVPEELTLEDCIKISEDPKNAPKKKYTRKKK